MVNAFDSEFGTVTRELSVEQMVRETKLREYIDLKIALALFNELKDVDTQLGILALEGMRMRLFYMNNSITNLIGNWEEKQNPDDRFNDIGDVKKRKQWKKENSILDKGTNAMYSLTLEEVDELRKLRIDYESLYIKICDVMLNKDTNFAIASLKKLDVE